MPHHVSQRFRRGVGFQDRSTSVAFQEELEGFREAQHGFADPAELASWKITKNQTWLKK